MDAAQWPQEIIVMKPIEEIVTNTPSCPKQVIGGANNIEIMGKPKSQRDHHHQQQPLNCPRCNSINTKFCYYNNYSLSQPRYFCKTCRRYWTEGGSLRNIPVGGGSRKHKKASSSSSPSSTTSSSSNSLKKLHDLSIPQNPKIPNQGQDLNLGFFPITQDFNNLPELVQVPNIDQHMSKSASTTSQFSALELLTGISSSRGLNSFIPMTNLDTHLVYSNGFSSMNHDFKPSLNFSLDGYGNLQGVGETSGRVLFPFEDLKQVSTTTTTGVDHDDQNKDQQHGDSNGFWTGILGGGSW